MSEHVRSPGEKDWDQYRYLVLDRLEQQEKRNTSIEKRIDEIFEVVTEVEKKLLLLTVKVGLILSGLSLTLQLVLKFIFKV